MFASFDKAFNKKKSIDIIPKPIVDALNKELPSGFKYQQIDKDTCALVPEGEEINISLDIMKDNEFNASSPAELMEYLYRTQKVIEVESNTIEINGHVFNVQDLIKVPFKNIEIDNISGKFLIKPHKFPEPFTLPIGYEDGEDKKIIEIKIQRQPLAELKKSLFKSIEMDSMEISYLIDEVSESMNMDIKISLEKAKSIEEIIEICKIYKSFISGKITIGNSIIYGKVNYDVSDDNFSDLITFWEKVIKLSKVLDVLFQPQDVILEEDVEMVETLYNSLIEKIDSSKSINTSKFTLKFKEKLEYDEVICGNPIVLQYVEFKKYSVLGEEIELYSVTTLSNFSIKEIVEDEIEEFKYDIEVHALTQEGVIQKIRFFKNKEEIDSYRGNLEYK